MLTKVLKIAIVSFLLVFLKTDELFAEAQQKVETVSKFDTRLLEEKKVSKVDAISWSSRYFSLLADFQKIESELFAYRKFFAKWDVPVKVNDEKVSRSLFEEIENIKKKLQTGLAKLDKVRLEILLNDDLKKNDKDQLFQSILQLKNSLKEIYFIPSEKGVDNGRVIDINKKLNSVIINLGIENSVFEGSRWEVRNEEEEIVADVQVFLVKRKLALAQVIKGNIDNIAINSLVKRKNRDL